MNFGRRTGTCICLQTAASGGVAETGGNRKDTETDRGGNVRTAEAPRDLRDPIADERETDGGAGAERAGRPSSTERTDGHPDTVTERTTGI